MRRKWHFLTTRVGYDRYVVPIYEASGRNGCVPLFKTLLSAPCSNNCMFCEFRCDKKAGRVEWGVEELARVVFKVWRDGRISGLFLSSCVDGDPDRTVEKEIEVVRTLRKLGFDAYVHLRVMPGTSRELIRQAVEVSDRIGINIEFPSSAYYDEMKIYLDFNQDVLRRMRCLATEVRKAKGCRAGIDTQFIVGAASETDGEILRATEWLYKKLGLRRVYYSAFEPIDGTPLQTKPPESKWREHRLYQGSFLIQRYGFLARDFVLDDAGMLPLDRDPKVLMARRLELCVNLEDADFEDLIKVPGIGLKAAKNLIELRRSSKLSVGQLKRAGVIIKRALPFLDPGRFGQLSLSHFA